MSPSRRRRGVHALQDRLGLSERRACQIAGQHRSTQRRELTRAADDAALREQLRAFSRKRPRWGYRRAHQQLLEDGWQINRKRTQRLWREEGLRVPRRARKRRRLGDSTVPADRLRAERPDQVWAIDFQFDQTTEGRILKLLHVVDEFTREALAIRCERRIDANATVKVLDGLIAERGAPEYLRSKFKETPYLGGLYIALRVASLVVAGFILHSGSTLAWGAAGVLATATLIGFVLSRTTGLPGADGDIGNWSEPLGLASMLVEGALLALSHYAFVLSRRERLPGVHEVVAEAAVAPPNA